MHTHLDTGSTATKSVGIRRAWAGQRGTRAWPRSPSQLGTWRPPSKDVPQRGTSNRVTLGEERTSQPVGQHFVSLPSGKTRLPPAECVCTCVCLCVSGRCPPGNIMPQVGVPLPTRLPPHSEFLGLSAPHHNPHRGWSSELPCVLAPVCVWGVGGEPCLYCKPRRAREHLRSRIHPLTPLLFLPFPPRRVGRGRGPWGGGVPLAFSLSLAICCRLHQACFERVCIKWMQAAIP